MAKARERGRGRIPRILMNGQAAAYSSFRRIQESVTLSRRTHVIPRNVILSGATDSRSESIAKSKGPYHYETHRDAIYSCTNSESCLAKTAARAAGDRSVMA